MSEQNRFSQETVFSSQNISYIKYLYELYCENHSSVPQTWQTYFQEVNFENFEENIPLWPKKNAGILQAASNSSVTHYSDLNLALNGQKLIEAYQSWGHLIADTNPLISNKDNSLPSVLQLSTYGLELHNLDITVPINVNGTFVSTTLKNLITNLQQTYCGQIGIEFTYIENVSIKNWIQGKLKNIDQQYHVSANKTSLNSLIKAELFEQFLHTKYPGAKRFGLEGGESLICALEHLVQQYGIKKTDSIVFGMAHRGRLSVLTNILHKPMRYFLAQFQNLPVYTDMNYAGDVKYHQGYTVERVINGHKIQLSLLPNPSHLESVDPVVVGHVRGKQDHNHQHSALGVLIHGDAAIIGQGLVSETFQLAKLKGYETGGTIHFVINNQVGFTANPEEGRSSTYCTDIAKTIQAPVLHVNGDNIDAVIWATQFACEFQQQFNEDIVIEIMCYRKHGHNEGDEPCFTQPLLYEKIKNHPSVLKIYEKKLIDNGLITAEELKNLHENFIHEMNKELEAASTLSNAIPSSPTVAQEWQSIKVNKEFDEDFTFDKSTGKNLTHLKQLGLNSLNISESFHIHEKVARILKQREQIFNNDLPLDWGTAESLAFASFLNEGYKVRLSGQDSKRGTFSHRHGVLFNQRDNQEYIPLNHLGSEQATINFINSPLSEAAVLGFEYGYSLVNPNTLVMWEAQFGDFVNGAQIIIDQYIAAGETKWQQRSGLVMLLPHGFEGQGSEHSSARLERFLQLSAENNWQIVNCSTPANYFHALRRQIHSDYRKPLIVMTPKSLLRHKLAVSNLEDFAENNSFKAVLDDTDIDKTLVEKIVLCSGKVYYDLLQERINKKINNVALIRVEQLYPFPTEQIEQILDSYNYNNIIWCQEEPENMGAWSFMQEQINKFLKNSASFSNPIKGVFRPRSACPAVGSLQRHNDEQNYLLQQIFEQNIIS